MEKKNVVLVKPLPLVEGQKIGAGVQGYEKAGFVNTPGTWEKKRVFKNKDGIVDTGMLYKVPNPLYEEIENPAFISKKETPKEKEFIPKDKSIPKEIWKWEEMEMKLNIRKDDPNYMVGNYEQNIGAKSLSPVSPFWKDFKVKLNRDGTTAFNISDPRKELEVLVLQGGKEVYPTLAMKNNPAYLGAKYYFEDIEKEAEFKESRNDNIIRSVEEYNSASMDMKRRYSRILGIVKSGNPSDKVIKGVLFDYIYGDEKKTGNRSAFLRIVDQFKSRPESIIALDEFKQAQECGIIRKIDGKYRIILPDNKPGREVGVDDDTCVTFLTDIQNNEFRGELRERINTYKNANVVTA